MDSRFPSVYRREQLVLGTVLALVVLASSFVMPVAAAEDPRFDLTVPEPELQPGTQQTLTVSITNDAEDVDDRVKTASNVEVTARSGSTPIEVVSGPRQVGILADGEPIQVNFQVEVPADTPGGTYRLPLDVTYEYDGDERERTTVWATVTVPERPIFSVEGVDVDLHPRETGVVTLTVKNTGSQPAADASLAVASDHPTLSVGEGSNAGTFLGDVEPDGTVEAVIPVTATQATLDRAYDLTVQPTYRTDMGQTKNAPSRTIGVSPAPKTRIAVQKTASGVSAGESGTVTWTVENRGDSVLSNAVLQFESGGSALAFEVGSSTSRYLGEFEPGETKTVTTDVSAAESVPDGTYPLRATLIFDHQEGFRSESGPYDLGISVSGSKPLIAVRNTDGEVSPGESGTVTWTLENRGDRVLSDAVLQFDAVGPELSLATAQSSNRFVGEWGPAETKTVTMDVSAAESVRNGTYPVRTVLTYDDRDNHRTESGPYTLGTRVRAPDIVSFDSMTVTHEGPRAVLSGRITNGGDRPLKNAVVHLDSRTTGITVLDGTTSLGTLDPGESAQLGAEIGIADSVSTAQQFEAYLRYEDRSGRAARTERTLIWAEQVTEENLFVVEPVNETLEIDSSNELQVRIRNDGQDTLSDIRARLAVHPPYGSQSPTAYVASLEPGESTILSFEVTTPEDGIRTEDTLSLNITGETEMGRTVIDGPHHIPITIGTEDSTGDSTIIAVLAVVVILLLGGGWWWLNR